MANITASGFGTTAVNGTYVDTGVFNGDRYYVLVNGGHTWYILWHNPDWWLKMDYLEADETHGAAYYFTSGSNKFGTWNPNAGTSPAGTVTAASVDYSLVAAQASFALSGIAVLFPVSRIFAAAAASFTLTGISAVLLYGMARSILAAASSFVLTTTSAVLSWREANHYSDKFSPRSTVYTNPLSARGTNYANKFSAQGTLYSRKF